MSSLSVTQVLKIAGLIDISWYTDEARDRGKAVHKATELVDEKDLDEDWLATTDDATRGRVYAYQRFCHEMPHEIIKSEFEARHYLLKFVGHPDRLVKFEGESYYTVLDLKPWGYAPWHGIQLAAYQHAIMRAFPSYGSPRRANVYLSNDGKYRVVPHTDPRDWNVFQAALIIAQWKEARY
jgi:hypothetical protein